MRHILYYITVALLTTVISCKDTTTTKEIIDAETTTPTEKRIAEMLDDPILSNDWKNEIQLDGSKKWEANEETTQGARNMLRIMENTAVGPEMDFKALGTKLKSEINIVIKKCSMKGASHDNLHVFLMPLIEKVDALQEENDIEKNKALVASIYYNLEAYDTYFK